MTVLTALVVTAIVDVTVVHPGRAEPTEAGMTVLIEGERIQKVGPVRTTRVPRGATVIRGRGKWVMPGLIDSHVHFFQSGNPYTRPDAADLRRRVPYREEVARNRTRLPVTFQVWLASGVTGVADLGGPFWNFEVRAAARASSAAPRVAVAGPLISMVDDPLLDLGDPPIIKVTSPEAARRLAQRELTQNPDFVKVWFIHRKGDDLAAQESIVKAAADTAHAASVRLAVHATELGPAKAALRAGADILVHSVWDKPVDDEFLTLARRNRVLYCPTLFVTAGYTLALTGQWQPTEAERRWADPQIVTALEEFAKLPIQELPPELAQRRLLKLPARPPPAAMANLRKVWDAGITVVLGTDAGNIGTVHGPSVFREAALMAEAGLTPREVVRAATANGARTLGRDTDLGDVAAGKLADLLILDADPLADVANLARIHRVFVGGRVFDPDALVRAIRAP